jgi:hypothetical protein
MGKATPRGPLVRFTIAVFKHVLDETISPATVKSAIERERPRNK